MNTANSTANVIACDGLLSMSSILALADCSRSHIHNLIAQGRFPAPLHCGPKFTRFKVSDVRIWLNSPAQYRVENAAEVKD